MQNRGIQRRAGERRPRPGQTKRPWTIWDWIIGGFYNG
jgi:hypothetical protein